MLENIHIITVVAGFFLTAGSTLFAAAWKLRGAVAELKEAIETARDEIEIKQEKYVRDVGESIAAIRQQMHMHEIYVRDTYIRKEDFRVVINDLKQVLEDRLERMEKKLDAK